MEAGRSPLASAAQRCRRSGCADHDHGVPLNQFALAWLRDAESVTAPIVGPHTRAHLDTAMASLGVTVDAQARAAVDAIVPPGTGSWLQAAEADARERAAAA